MPLPLRLPPSARSRTRLPRSPVLRAAVLAVAVLLASVLVPPAPAAAAPAAPSKLVAVVAHFVDDGIGLPSSIPCPGGRAIRGDAAFGVRLGDTWRGTVLYDYCITPSLLPDTVTISGIATFTGTIDGCSSGVGLGSVSYLVTNGFAQLLPIPTAPNGILTWSLVPGSATGTLSNVVGGSGPGIFSIRLILSNDGYFIGSVLC